MQFATEGSVSCWEDLIAVESGFASPGKDYCFRGQGKDYPLRTTLDRVRDNFNVPLARVRRLEQQFITDFKRLYSKYASTASPALGDSQLWLSLMRHHGAPTRLLDFTYSFFIAAYFALEDAEEDSVVWAINRTWLGTFGQAVMERIGGEQLRNAWGKREGWAFDKIFWEQDPSGQFVYPTNSFRLHERNAEQQALFLCPGDVTVSFQQNLEAMGGCYDRENVCKILIKGGNTRMQIIQRLYRTGLNRAALFPGLDGFAQSLRYKTPVFLDLLDKDDTGVRVGSNLP